VIDKVVGQDELPPQPEDNSESEAMATEEEMIKECPVFNFGDFFQLNSTDSPYLLKLFGGEGKVLKSHLNAILLELFKALGKKTSASVEFEYKNGSKGRAILVPRVKNEDSFWKQAKKLHWIESLLDHVSEKMMQPNGWLITLGKDSKDLSHLF
jgi:hypothetical protein